MNAQILSAIPNIASFVATSLTAIKMGGAVAVADKPTASTTVSSSDAALARPSDALSVPLATTAVTPATATAAGGGISSELSAAMARARGATSDCSWMAKAFIEETNQGVEVALIPFGRAKLPTAPGVTEEIWYLHAGVELPSKQLVDIKLNAVHPSVEAWRKAVVGDNKVKIMRNGMIEK